MLPSRVQSRLLSPVSNFVDAVGDLCAAVRSALEFAAAAAVHLAGVVVRARAREEGRVVVYALLPASQACWRWVRSNDNKFPQPSRPY